MRGDVNEEEGREREIYIFSVDNLDLWHSVVYDFNFVEYSY